MLDADAGEDVLTGGAGNDVLRGGAGRDAYAVNLGDGGDQIEDAVEAGVGNVLTFGQGISREDVHVEVEGSDLLVHYGASGDFVRVNGYAPAGAAGVTVIYTLEFADGTAITLREFMNRAPEMADPVGDQILLEDAAFSLTLPDDLFVDVDGDAVLAHVTVSGYQSRPDWLHYDAATRTLFGIPANGGVGAFDIVLHGMDAMGASAYHSFHVTIQNTNDAPQTGTTLADQLAREDAAFVYTLPTDSFSDVDAGDVLSYSVSLENGAALPDWLSFDAQTQTFSGQPANGHVGDLRMGRGWPARHRGGGGRQTGASKLAQDRAAM